MLIYIFVPADKGGSDGLLGSKLAISTCQEKSHFGLESIRIGFALQLWLVMIHKYHSAASFEAQQRRVEEHRGVVLEARVRAGTHKLRDVRVHAVLNFEHHVRESALNQALKHGDVEVVAIA